MIKISKIIYAGGASPYQLEANTEDGKWLYIRYRNGMLRYVVAQNHTQWTKSKKDSWYDFSQKIGEDFDGVAEHDKIYPYLKDHIDFPEEFKIQSYPYIGEQP
jgi:hypothetical protein